MRAGAERGNDVARPHLANVGGRRAARAKGYGDRQLRIAKAYDNGIVTGDGALHVAGVHRITFDNGESRQGGQLRGIARKSCDRMAIRQQLRYDSAARAAGGSENDDVHASHIGARRAASSSGNIAFGNGRLGGNPGKRCADRFKLCDHIGVDVVAPAKPNRIVVAHPDATILVFPHQHALGKIETEKRYFFDRGASASG